jgi:hypothetical protein
MRKNRIDRWVVYWLYDETCTNPELHGYIGATGRFWARIGMHKKSGRFASKHFEIKILYRSSNRQACLAYEKQLRPHPDIGWNIHIGGFQKGGGGKGIPKSPEHRAKQREAALRRYADPAERKRTQRAVKKAFKTIDRSGANNAMFGRKQSEETKRKIGDKALARDVSGKRNPNYRHGEYCED